MVSKRVTNSKSLFISSVLSFSIASAISAPVSAAIGQTRPHADHGEDLNNKLNLPESVRLRDPKTVNSPFDRNSHTLQRIELDGETTKALCNTYEDRDGNGKEDIEDPEYVQMGNAAADDDNYKFLVEPGASNNLLIFFEGGGGCWDYMTCTEKGGAGDNSGGFGKILSYSLTDKAYIEMGMRIGMTSWPTSGASANWGPHLLDLLPEQAQSIYHDWTKVYLPYCSQDLFVGDNTPTYSHTTPENPNVTYLDDYFVYKDPDPNHEVKPLKFRHHGAHILATVTSWAREHLPTPEKLLVTGQSAGGFASELTYHYLRSTLGNQYDEDFDPVNGTETKGYLFNDSGTFFLAENEFDENGNVIKSSIPQNLLHPQPSAFIHETIVNSQWGHRPYLKWLEEQSASLPVEHQFRINNMGTISTFLDKTWTDDRFMLTAFQRDLTIAGFSYNSVGFVGLDNEPDQDVRNVKRERLRMREVQSKLQQLEELDNWGYFFPFYRPAMAGHVTSLNGVNNTARLNWAVKDGDNEKTVRDAIHNLLSEEEDPLMKAFELDPSRKDLLKWADCGNYYHVGLNAIDEFTNLYTYSDMYSAWNYTTWDNPKPKMNTMGPGKAMLDSLDSGTPLFDAAADFVREIIDPCWFKENPGLEPIADTYTRGGEYENDDYRNETDLMVKNSDPKFDRHAYFKFQYDHIRHIPSKVTLRYYVSEVGDYKIACNVDADLNWEIWDYFWFIDTDILSCDNGKAVEIHTVDANLNDYNNTYKHFSDDPMTKALNDGIVYNPGWHDIDVTNEVVAQLNDKNQSWQVFRLSIASHAAHGDHWMKIDSMESTRPPRLLFEYEHNNPEWINVDYSVPMVLPPPQSALLDANTIILLLL